MTFTGTVVITHMKEFEYIVLATDEVFSHIITSVICMENYYNDTSENGFRTIFTLFNNFRMDYKDNMEHVDFNNRKALEVEAARFKIKCKKKREDILTSFIKELRNIDKTINYEEKIKEYYNRIENEDVETLEMQLMIYPYLMSLVRKNEEEMER